MEKEYSVIMDGKVAGRVVGRERLGDITPLVAEESEVFVVYDANAAEVAAEVIEAVPCVRGCIALETSEEDKSMDTVLLIAHSLLEAGASRKALVLAVGGGITTDLAGFAASIYKRGIRYANVPTTLLAQVDAAVGGKTGVNFDDYKNMLGVIVQPVFTFVCADALRTLPHRDFLSGAAELLKTFLIENEDDHYGRAVRWLAEGGAAAELQELGGGTTSRMAKPSRWASSSPPGSPTRWACRPAWRPASRRTSPPPASPPRPPTRWKPSPARWIRTKKPRAPSCISSLRSASAPSSSAT